MNANFDNGKDLVHDTTAGLRVPRYPKQHSPLTSAQLEEIILTARGMGISSKLEFLAVISSAAGRNVNELSELVDVDQFRVLSALRSKKRRRKPQDISPPDDFPDWKWPREWKPK